MRLIFKPSIQHRRRRQRGEQEEIFNGKSIPARFLKSLSMREVKKVTLFAQVTFCPLGYC